MGGLNPSFLPSYRKLSRKDIGGNPVSGATGIFLRSATAPGCVRALWRVGLFTHSNKVISVFFTSPCWQRAKSLGATAADDAK